MKNNQNGFIGIAVVVIALVALGASSYVAYNKDTFGMKTRFEAAVSKEAVNKNTLENTEVATQPEKPSQPSVGVKDTSAEQISTNTSVTTAVGLNCNGSLDCLIAAANQCQAANAVINVTNVANPFFKDVFHSGTTKHELKKSGTLCMLSSTPLTHSMTLSAAGRAEMKKEGITDAEIDEEIKVMNETAQEIIGLKNTCTGTNAAIASHLADQKSGFVSGSLSFSSDRESSTSEITTSSDLKVTCTN